MPEYIYHGEDRVYHDFGNVSDGDIREAKKAPDFRWTPLDQVKAVKEKVK